MRILLLLLLFPFLSNAQMGGRWYSNFKVMGQPFQMQLTIVDGSWPSATIDDLGNNAMLHCDSLRMTDSTLFFQWDKGGLNYRGKLVEKGRIEGKMRQNGLTWDAVFTREKPEPIVINHWQDPKGPFPYTSDSLQIPNGDIELGATLVLPENFNASTPIVVLVSGSGPQNRDSEILGHKLFAVIADHLARQGIASLRFDDRQMGTSTGVYGETSLMEFGSDVEACVRYLRKVKHYKKNDIGIMGHSEGGMHALIAVSNYKKIDFLIEFSAIGISGRQTLIQQQYDIPKAKGHNEEISRWNQHLFEGMSEIIVSVPKEQAADSLASFLGYQYDHAPASYDKFGSSRQNFIINNILFLNNDWGREFLSFEVAPYLKKLKVPLLAIHGAKDIQVDAVPNSEALATYKRAECHILPGLNHLGQHCSTCTAEEYGNLDETVAPEILELMTDWILNLK